MNCFGSNVQTEFSTARDLFTRVMRTLDEHNWAMTDWLGGTQPFTPERALEDKAGYMLANGALERAHLKELVGRLGFPYGARKLFEQILQEQIEDSEYDAFKQNAFLKNYWESALNPDQSFGSFYGQIMLLLYARLAELSGDQAVFNKTERPKDKLAEAAAGSAWRDNEYARTEVTRMIQLFGKLFNGGPGADAGSFIKEVYPLDQKAYVERAGVDGYLDFIIQQVIFAQPR